MKKETMINKKTVIAGLAAVAICLAAGLFYYVGVREEKNSSLPNESDIVIQETVTVPEVTVPVTEGSRATESETETEPKETAETEESESAVQVQTEESKAATVKTKDIESKPQLPEQATAPSREPEPQEIEPSHEAPPVPETSAPAVGTTNEQGQVYVPGFGYVDGDGGVTVDQAHSDGDWNKQIGTMQ